MSVLEFLANRRAERRQGMDLFGTFRRSMYERQWTYIWSFVYCYEKPSDFDISNENNYNLLYHYNMIGNKLGMTFQQYRTVKQSRCDIIHERIRRSRLALLTLVKKYLKRKKIARNKAIDETLGRVCNMPRELTNMICEYL